MTNKLYQEGLREAIRLGLQMKRELEVRQAARKYGLCQTGCILKHENFCCEDGCEIDPTIANAMRVARDKVLEDVLLVVSGWRENDWSEGFNFRSAEHVVGFLEDKIRAMKSTGG